MAKKDKIEVPNSNSIANKDTLQRLNFLYQASIFMNSLPSSLPSSPERPVETKSGPSNPKKKRSTSSRKRNWSALELSRAYVEDAKAVAQKTTTRMDPSVKRTLCKGCSCVLVPGVSCRVRVKASSSHEHSVSYICSACGTTRRIPAPPLLLDPEATTEETTLTTPGTRQRKRARPRQPPLFQRDVGHVVFRGNVLLQPVEDVEDDAMDEG